jgi:hypothetical protein
VGRGRGVDEDVSECEGVGGVGCRPRVGGDPGLDRAWLF